MNTQTLLTVMQLVLSFSNICILAYAFMKFINKPHDSLDQRVSALEVELKETKQSLHQGNDRFREQEDTNEVLLRSLLALIEFEIQYLLQENKPISRDLEKAKDDLHSFLSKR